MGLRHVAVVMAVVGAGAAFAQVAATGPAHGEAPAATYPGDAPAPIIRDKFAADPDARVFDGRYYVYPTVDRDQWKTTEFNVWSSADLIHWKDEGTVLDLGGGDVSWAKLYAWAPGVATRGGKYYMYFCGDKKIGVAVADKPTGPFKEALGHAFIEPGNPPELKGQQIDPCPFVDDTGEAYLYWGNGHMWVRKLAADMVSFDGELKDITPKFEGGRYNEGTFVIKRKGVYYFMWSENDARSPDYRVAYGTSDSPLGPIKVPPPEQRIILSKSGSVVGTGHNSVINVPGTDRWYMVYHRHAIPGGNGFIREVCLSPLKFNDDGTIAPVDVNHPAFAEGSAGEPITPQKN